MASRLQPICVDWRQKRASESGR